MDKELEEAIERLQKNKKQSLYNGECALVDIKDLDIVLEALDGFISKKAVKKQIEELKKERKRLGRGRDWHILTEKIQLLEEILENNKHNQISKHSKINRFADIGKMFRI